MRRYAKREKGKATFAPFRVKGAKRCGRERFKKEKMSEIFGKKNYKASLQGLCCVEVSGESCANCLTLMPLLKSIADARGDIRLVHVEADYDTAALMEEWDVSRVPTVLLMDDGKIFARCSGFQPEEILEIWIDAKIQEYKSSQKS